MKFMTRKQVFEAIEAVKNGQFVRVSYLSEMPLKAEWKKKGYKINKITECTGRLGVDYDNIKAVKDWKDSHTPSGRVVENHYSWVVPNKIAYNSKTDKEYLRITTSQNQNTKKKYVIVDSTGKETEINDLGEYKDYVINSYWKPGQFQPVRNVKLENIISIGNTGSVVFYK